MDDLLYKAWQIKNDDKLVKLDLDLYYDDIENNKEELINFDFIRNKQLKVKISSDILYVNYLPYILNVISSHNFNKLTIDKNVLQEANNTRTLLKKHKDLVLTLKQDIYIRKELYTYMKRRIEMFKRNGGAGNFRISDFQDMITDAMEYIRIPYTVENIRELSNNIYSISLLKLLIGTTFSKEFFKYNSFFKTSFKK